MANFELDVISMEHLGSFREHKAPLALLWYGYVAALVYIDHCLVRDADLIRYSPILHVFIL